MALKITDNFNYTGRKPNFQRDQFATTSEMNAYTVCDEGHISYNLQDNKHYSFKNGAWSVLQTGGGGSSYTHPSSHPASIITYDSSKTYEPGNVGYEIKQLVTSLAAKYIKPGTGIPKADLANDVQTSLGYADDYSTNKSSFVTSTALETALTGLSPYSAGTGILITTVSNGKQIAVDTAVYKVKDVQNASGTSLVNNGIATIPTIPADQSTEIKNIKETIAKIGNNQPIVIPSSAVELPVSTSDPDYIDYDSDTTYVMNIDGTQVATIHYPYVDNNNNYVAFKAIDRDLYYVYSVSVVNDAERYTYSNQYTWSTLPADAKSKFESGIYAIKQVINDDGTLPEKKWYKNIPSVFVDKNNLPLRSRRINETISSSVIDVLLVKNDRLNKIYRYAFNGISNAWVLINGGCYTKDDATTGENYTKYDVYFDRQPASNVSFDDQNINIGADNVQDAIRIAFTNIQSTTCTLNLTVYKDSAVLANKSVHIDVTYQGVVSSTLSGDYTTSSQGLISVSLPLGSIYTITFNDETNYRKPDTINGIADDNIKNISVLYETVAENEKVLAICTVKNTTGVYPNNKVAYIHYTNSDYTQNISVNPEWTLTFGANGMVKTIVHNGNIETECLIPFGTYYTVELEDWDSSEEQAYSKSAIVKTRALSETRVINLYYSYLLSGLFVVIKDDNDNVYGYTSYKVTNTDTTNDITTILMNDIEYDIRYTAGIGVEKSLKGQNDYSTWIAAADMDSTIIGIGVRNNTLINSTALDDDGTQQGYTNCCFMLCKVTYPTTTYKYITQGPDYRDRDCKDGRFITNLAASQEIDRPVITAVTAITKQTGNHTQHAFLASGSQWTAFYLNYNTIKSIGKSLNIIINLLSGTYWLSTSYYVQNARNGNDYGSLTGYNDLNYTAANPGNPYKLVPFFSFN